MRSFRRRFAGAALLGLLLPIQMHAQEVKAGSPVSVTVRGILSASFFAQDALFGLGNGHQRWSRQLPTRPRGGPVLFDKRVMVVLADGRLAQFAADDKGTTLTEEPSPDASIRVLGFGASPDGQLIAAVGAPADNSRQLMAWRAASLEWQTPQTPPVHGNWGEKLPVVYRWAYAYGANGGPQDYIAQNAPPEAGGIEPDHHGHAGEGVRA